MTVRQLDSSPRLPVELARGGLASLRKRGPYEGARLPDERLVLRTAEVDATKLRAYARVCGFDEGAAELPPTYPHLLGFPLQMRLMAQRAFPFPLLGLVHTDIELSSYRAIRTDERPEVSVYAEEPQPHRRGTSFGVVTEARIDGEAVWHSRSIYLCRHRTSKPGGPESTTGTGTADASDVSGNSDSGGGTGDVPADTTDPAAGPFPPRATWELPSGLGRRYAAASGDRNPIHLHPLSARLFGFPRHIAHGMWTFARCIAEAEGASGPAGTTSISGSGLLTAHARFKAPVLLPSTITYHAAEERNGSGENGAGKQDSPGGVTVFEVRGGENADRLHLTGSLHRAPNGT